MADFIDRETLMKFPIRRDHCDKEHANEHFINGIETVMEYAENLPAADVEPVLHGRWERCFEDWRRQIEGDKCSACGFEYYGACIRRFLYCPNCGAKMNPKEEDGGKEDA